MAETQRRWSFVDGSLHQPNSMDVQALLEARRQPTLEVVQRRASLALWRSSRAVCDAHQDSEMLEQTQHDRALKLREAAVELATGGGEGDLRRLKREFSNLQDIFVHADVEQSFMEGLAASYPDGFEEEGIAEAQKELKKAAALVTHQESKNSQLECEIEQLIEEITKAHRDFNSLKGEMTAQLERFAAEEAQRLASWPETVPPLDDGPDMATCQKRIAEESAHTRLLEEELATEEAEAKELAAAIQAEEEQLESLRTQIQEAELKDAENQTVPIIARLSDSAVWLDDIIKLTQQFSGVEIVAASSNPIQLRLTTHYSDPAGVDGVSTCSHRLSLILLPEKCAYQSAVLEPQDVDLSDLTAVVPESRNNLAFLICETQARLREHLARSAAIKEAAEKFETAPADGDAVAVTLPSGVMVTLSVPRQWPEGGGVLSVTGLVTASGMQMSEEIVRNTQPPKGGRAGLLASIEYLAEEIGKAFDSN